MELKHRTIGKWSKRPKKGEKHGNSEKKETQEFGKNMKMSRFFESRSTFLKSDVRS